MKLWGTYNALPFRFGSTNGEITIFLANCFIANKASEQGEAAFKFFAACSKGFRPCTIILVFDTKHVHNNNNSMHNGSVFPQQ